MAEGLRQIWVAGEVIREHHRPRTIAEVQKAVTRSCFVSVEHIVGRSREPSHVEARHLAMYLARRIIVDENGKTHPRASYTKLAEAFNRDHTTVINGVRQTEKRIAKDRYLAGKAALIESLFGVLP